MYLDNYFKVYFIERIWKLLFLGISSLNEHYEADYNNLILWSSSKYQRVQRPKKPNLLVAYEQALNRGIWYEKNSACGTSPQVPNTNRAQSAH